MDSTPPRPGSAGQHHGPRPGQPAGPGPAAHPGTGKGTEPGTGSRPGQPAGAHPAADGEPPQAPLPAPRFAYDRATWKEVAHLLVNLPMAVVGFVYVVTTLALGAGLSVTVVGLPLLAVGLMGSRGLGRIERARARRFLGVRVEEPRPLRAKTLGGFLPWLWTTLKDPVAWRSSLFLAVRLPWGILTFTVTLVALFLLWPVLPFLARAMAALDRSLVRGLLSPSDGLERRIAELESDRGVVVDTAAADLRRIERDLHDGAQARLVALAMDLGLAREKLLEDPEAAAKMVGEAHGEVKIALQELRDLARGIHPAILTDRGLDAALSSVASRCTVPVAVNVDLAARPAEAIEGIAYFTVSELLQNVSKHSRARGASVEVWRGGDRLMLQVRDDGKGGADVSGGSGLAGLAERLRSVDGLFVVSSPEGGPTVVTAELPWRDRSLSPSGPR
ncbi:sensor domain-containing protein [Actinacidiphila yeochonensis]|uniref:sensor domain-containing protein n=1 Tax=Actinacidiphila yeochonensis TaxID=89050 RepID=UPI00099BD0A2|nr:sensor domain-containing protein [Actinacidiphila yeochonensis]